MPDITPFLKELMSVPGLSGYEDPATEVIRCKWTPLVDELKLSKLGSLHGLRRGTGPEPRPSVMICTHSDAIGLMVSGIQDGFLRVTNVGGVDARVLPGQIVTVHASGPGGGDLPAVVAQPGARLLPGELGDAPIPLEHLFVDTGLPPRKVAQIVRVGDLVSYGTEAVEHGGDYISGHTLDDRAAVAALTVCLEELQHRPHTWDVWAVATSQEEVGTKGAITSAYELRPTIALVSDVTFARGPGVSDWMTVPIGEGPTLTMGPNIHPALFKFFKELAEKLEIPHVLEYAPRHTGTDTFSTQVAAAGIPSMLFGIPLRYMHTPVELISVKDVQRLGRLMAEFIAGLTPDFMEKITWEE